MLQRPARFRMAGRSWSCAVGVALAIYRWRVIGRELTLVFDEQPEPLVRTLDLWA